MVSLMYLFDQTRSLCFFWYCFVPHCPTQAEKEETAPKKVRPRSYLVIVPKALRAHFNGPGKHEPEYRRIQAVKAALLLAHERNAKAVIRLQRWARKRHHNKIVASQRRRLRQSLDSDPDSITRPS